jgi:hypothetical protein
MSDRVETAKKVRKRTRNSQNGDRSVFSPESLSRTDKQIGKIVKKKYLFYFLLIKRASLLAIK